MVESGEKNHCERGSAMQELISALTAHEEECSREFEADLSAFCTRHMDAQLLQQLRQLVAEEEEDLAYRAFYALTIIYRNRKDYQQLQALFEENPRFAGHPSYHHLLILFQLEAETFFDALELLELAREDARQHRDNAGYLHLFAHLFVYTCEKSRGEMREQVRREYYDDVEQAVEDAIRLDPAYAKFYCTKARVVAQRGRYAEAYSLINKAVATESSARKDYALRLLDYRHCETVILLQEQREYFQGEMEKLRRSVPSLPKPKTFVPGRGPKAYEGAEPYCFVSYAHINSDRVYPIVEQLMQRGIRLWYDDVIEARQLPEVREMLLRHRRMMNRPGGYWIAGFNPEAARHGSHRVYRREELSRVVLFSDGFSGQREALLGAEEPCLQELYRQLRQREAADSRCNRYPRLKPGDDVSGIVAVF